MPGMPSQGGVIMKRYLMKKRLSVLLMLLFFICLGLSVFGQEKKGDGDKDKKLREEILAVYKSKGEEGVRDFVKGKRGSYDKYLIINLCEAGLEEKNKELLKVALVFAEEYDDEVILAYARFKMGEYYLSVGNFEKMVEYFEKAIPVLEKINAPNINKYLNPLKKMIDSFKNGLAGIEKIVEEELKLFEKDGNFRYHGDIYVGMSALFLKNGANINAHEMLEKALVFYKQTGNPNGQGKVYYARGGLYGILGNYNKAIEMFDKAISLFEESGNLSGRGLAHQGKGLSFESVREYSNALRQYEKARQIFEKTRDNLNNADMITAKGRIYQYTGNYSSALNMYNLALTIFEQEEYPIGIADVYYKKGGIFFLKGNYQAALQMCETAMAYYGKFGYLHGMEYNCLQKAIIHSIIGDPVKESEMYEKALSINKKSGSALALPDILTAKAAYLVRSGKNGNALPLFEEAMEKLEKIREQGASPKTKIALMVEAYDKYKKVVLFMLGNNYYAKSFKYAESMKARLFLDNLAEGLVNLEKGINPQLKQKRDNLVAKLSILSKEITKTAGKNDEKKLAELKEERRKIESEFEDLLIKIRLENPLYASVQYPRPVSLKELQEKVLKKGELMLRYFITEERTYVFLVSRKKLKVYPLNITSDEIHKLANRYILSVKGKNKEKLSEYGTKLYQSLFKPLEPLLKGKKNLIIVPDGQLATIPFESFITGKNKTGNPVYLLGKYKIKYIQSASVLSIMRKHYKRTSKTQNFIGFGDPVYDFENFKKGLPEQGSTNPVKGDEIKDIHRGKYDREGGVLDRLQGSGREVQTIAGLFQDQGQKAVIHLRGNATEENAKTKDLKNFDYIHFSCHGVLGDGFQSLVLSQVPGAKEDGYLTLNEIMNCDYNAKLVVLSACQTGTGKVERGEGVTGLTRAVMYAGTPAVVASLWNVSDIGTKELMVRFYQNILEKGMSKEDALREAKLSLLRSEKYSSPYYWSPFVMYGE